QLRLGALASSVALVAGISDLHGGTTADVLDNLTALLSTVSAHGVTVGEHTIGAVPDAPVLALALLQLVINARRHDDATEVTVDIDAGPAFRVRWRGELPPQGVSTARHQADRDRWGLGFVRLAMDALGGIFLSPASQGPGQITAVLAIDPSPRLQLPMAAVRDGVVDAASPAWDEETQLPPGSRLPERWSRLVDAASSSPGVIQRARSARARAVEGTVWIAIPAEGTADRARDVIRGLEHERDLLDAPQPFATLIEGLAGVIALLLGDHPHRVTPTAFDEGYPRAADAVAAPPFPGRFTGPAAPSPALIAVIASRVGAILSLRDDRLAIQASEQHRGDSMIRRLGDGTGIILLPYPRQSN
ncbi:MAG TPA: hypothetical protein VN959_02835, partial [Mycobacterium sp.]|nr:hypothetical protein [Mycobacterium sp.]